MVENPRITVGISTVSTIVPDISISGSGGHIAISGCRSLSQSFGDTFFDVAVVEKLDFVTWITTILILDQFCHISQHYHKISLVSKNSHVFDVMPNKFRCTYWRPDCCILYSLHIQESHEMTAPNPEEKFFTESKTELGLFFTPKCNARVNIRIVYRLKLLTCWRCVGYTIVWSGIYECNEYIALQPMV